MIQSGITTEGFPVFSGVFPLLGTHGIPLEIILDDFQRKNKVMDWPDYIAGAIKDGHKPNTIRSRILSAVGDVYGAKYCSEVEKRLNNYLE